MDNTKLITILVSASIILVMLNLIFSKVIFDWELGTGRRIRLLALLWLLPVVGIVLISRMLKLGWFREAENSGAANGASFGLLELDSVFNPGARHVLEEKQREQTEQHRDGKLDDPGSDRL